jgi:uncharacterized protein YjiS (DUF1127 family)
MQSLIMRPAGGSLQLHQKNWGAALSAAWRRWRLRWARHGQRRALRELADNPHLLRDIGVTREQALEQAGKPIWAMTDVYVRSI